jgi:hypothetical protein
LPDRNAGRPEHRPDRVAGDLRAHQRIRLPRNALSQGQGRPRHRQDIDYLTADREEQYIVAQANAPIDDKGNFTTDRVVPRKGDFIDVEPARVDYMDVSPKQVVRRRQR